MDNKEVLLKDLSRGPFALPIAPEYDNGIIQLSCLMRIATALENINGNLGRLSLEPSAGAEKLKRHSYQISESNKAIAKLRKALEEVNACTPNKA